MSFLTIESKIRLIFKVELLDKLSKTHLVPRGVLSPRTASDHIDNFHYQLHIISLEKLAIATEIRICIRPNGRPRSNIVIGTFSAGVARDAIVRGSATSCRIKAAPQRSETLVSGRIQNGACAGGGRAFLAIGRYSILKPPESSEPKSRSFNTTRTSPTSQVASVWSKDAPN
jgi:hypothetical protein